MRTTTTVLAVCLLLTGVAGCASNDEPDQSVSKATTSPAPTTASPTPSPSEKTFTLGDTADISSTGKKWTATATNFKDDGITSLPGMLADGSKWALVEVKVCNTGGETFEVGPFSWTLAYEDGSRFDPSYVTGGGLPQPVYPDGAKVRAGDCVRGNITFEVPEGSGRPERVLYSPEGLDEPVEWLVK